MGKGIATGEAEIMCPYKYLPVLDYNAAYGTFPEIDRFLGFLYGFEHKLLLFSGRLEVRV